MNKVTKNKIFALVDRLVGVGTDTFNQQNISDSLARIKIKIKGLKEELKDTKEKLAECNNSDIIGLEQAKTRLTELKNVLIPTNEDLIDMQEKEYRAVTSLIKSHSNRVDNLSNTIADYNIDLEKLNAEASNYSNEALEKVVMQINNLESKISTCEQERYDSSSELASSMLRRAQILDQINYIKIQIEKLKKEQAVLREKESTDYIGNTNETLLQAQIEQIKNNIEELEKQKDLLSINISELGEQIKENVADDKEMEIIEKDLNTLDCLANHYQSILRPIQTTGYTRIITTKTTPGMEETINQYKEMLLSSEQAQIQKGLDINLLIAQIIQYQNISNEYQCLLDKISLFTPKEQLQYKETKKKIVDNIKEIEAKLIELKKVLNGLVDYFESEKRLQQTINLKMTGESIDMMVSECKIGKNTINEMLKLLEVKQQALNHESINSSLASNLSINEIVDLLESEKPSILDVQTEEYGLLPFKEVKPTLLEKKGLIDLDEEELNKENTDIPENVQIINDDNQVLSINDTTLTNSIPEIEEKPEFDFENQFKTEIDTSEKEVTNTEDKRFESLNIDNEIKIPKSSETIISTQDETIQEPAETITSEKEVSTLHEVVQEPNEIVSTIEDKKVENKPNDDFNIALNELPVQMLESEIESKVQPEEESSDLFNSSFDISNNVSTTNGKRKKVTKYISVKMAKRNELITTGINSYKNKIQNGEAKTYKLAA